MRRAAVVLSMLMAGALAASACSKKASPQKSFTPSAGEVDDDNEDAKDGIDGDGGAPPSSNTATPIPSKIRYVIVLIKENHTLDNYFTGFPGADTSPDAKISKNVTVARKQAPTELMKDICHSNKCGQQAYADGGMDGFGTSDPLRPYYFYSESQIPNYWQYARNFVLADHMFSTTLGPSTPGHAVFWTGQSLVLDNAKCVVDGGECKGAGCNAGKDVTITSYDPDVCTTKTVQPCFDVPSLPDHLPSGFTWANYGGPISQMVKSVASDPGYAAHYRKQDDLVRDLTAGNLANLTIGHLWSGDVSEHPAAYPCPGENYTVDIINAAMKLPQWNEMAIVITWDDWGGWYDHVTPPVRRCKNGQIFQAGFRVPAIVVSPYAKTGYVLKTPTEQASVPRLVEELWGMPFMTARDPHARDGVSGSLMDAFDFNQTPRQPLILSKHTCPE